MDYHKDLKVIFIIVTIAPTVIRLLKHHIFSAPTLLWSFSVDGICVSIAVGISCSSTRLNTLERVVESIRYGQLGFLAGGEVGGRVQVAAGQPGVVSKVTSTVTHPRHIVKIPDFCDRGRCDCGAGVISTLP